MHTFMHLNAHFAKTDHQVRHSVPRAQHVACGEVAQAGLLLATVFTMATVFTYARSCARG
jgi:hypothetical protein